MHTPALKVIMTFKDAYFLEERRGVTVTTDGEAAPNLICRQKERGRNEQNKNGEATIKDEN